MANTATVASEVASKASALGSSPSRLSSDFRDDLDRIGAGSTGLQILTGSAGFAPRDSNVEFEVARIELSLHHHLSDGSNERAWTEGQRLTDLASLMDRGWWRAIASIHDVLEGPESASERNGHVITDTITVQVLVQP